MKNILIAGFGGQGILFAGKFLVYGGMAIGKKVSWLPSYGPEMRGGTANCGVIISDTPIGSPIVTTPDILIIMNGPSLDKFEESCTLGATVIIDESLVSKRLSRTDLNGYYIPATRLAGEYGLDGLANMIMIGRSIAAASLIPYECVGKAMSQSVPERKKAMYDNNIKAIEIGYEFSKQGI